MNGMTTLKLVKPSTNPQRATQTTMDTIAVTPDEIRAWKDPPFQRPLKVNAKVRAIAEQIKLNEVIPGIITIGVMGKERYLLDGQHRREAFLISGAEAGYCDVRIHYFDTMADMGREFVELNSRIVNLRPDDILRGLEDSNEAIAHIRKRCPFVGYDMIRRSERAPILSMSLALRAWFSSAAECPNPSGHSAISMAETLSVEAAAECSRFLLIAEGAWGRDHAYQRLWSALNLGLCMWLYRRVVPVQKNANHTTVSAELFGKALMSLSASDSYLSWLVGRQVGDRDRSPAYARLKHIMVKRVEAETGAKCRWPAPAWAASHVKVRK